MSLKLDDSIFSVKEPVDYNPKKLVIYSKPKVGKTEAIVQLPDTFTIDLERGTRFVKGAYINVLMEAEKREMSPLAVLHELHALLKEKRPFKRISIDTVTVLEDISLPYAKSLYKKSPQGTNFALENVLHLPNGAGYMWTREAFFKILKGFEECADEIIYVGHIKSTLINKDGKEVSAKDIDLTGKIKSMLCADADAIGILYREGNDCILSFETSDEVICGARPKHLSNQKIVLSTMTDKGLITNWDKIYLPTNKQK